MNFVYKKFYLKLKKYYAVFADVTVWTSRPFCYALASNPSCNPLAFHCFSFLPKGVLLLFWLNKYI